MISFLKHIGAVWGVILYRVEQNNRRMLFYIFYPLLVWCRRVGISPLFFTLFRLVLLPVLYLLFEESLFWAGFLLILMILSDMLDGALARYLEIASDRGKFEDHLSDHLLYGVCLLGLLSLRAVSAHVLGYQLLIFPVLMVLAILKKHEHTETDWVIKPRPDIGYYKFLFFVFFFVYLFFAKNYLNGLIWIMNILMTLQAIYYFSVLQRRWARSK